MTFSIVARCAETGMFGVAVASSSPAAAARCAYARAGVGAAASQNVTDPRLGPRALDLMALGATAPEAVAVIARPRTAPPVFPGCREDARNCRTPPLYSYTCSEGMRSGSG